jgi:outer membrane protein OmpA-like peptidoglycan-associated protein/tetratricopeptide (TPR) repeat protein
MKLLFNFLISIVSLGTLSAQGYDPEKVNPKAVAIYEQAFLKLQDGETKAAIPLLQKAIALVPNYVDAILSLGSVYGELKDYAAAVTEFEKAKSIDSAYFKYYNLPYSINLAGLGQFEKALTAIEQFLLIPGLNERSLRSGSYRKKAYRFAIDYAAKHPAGDYVFAPQNMGDSVNSDKSEYYPSITIDDSLFVFTRRGEGFREDFIECTILPNKQYSKSKLIDGDINLEASKGAINISQDGEWLLFTGYNFRGGYGDFDLHISYYTPTGWSEPENLGSNINTEFWESSPSLSPDKRTLFFSSNRPGGYGGKDLYVSYRQANGRWSKAENMGPDVNTAGDELAPFIHADNATLYFTSDGLQGYGQSDIFLCRKGPDGSWSKPENLGYPINTIENEGSLFVASNGKTAFYASDRSDSRGGLDIYTFELRSDIRPAKTLYVQGFVTDSKTNKGLPCTVELTDKNNKQSITKVQTDETGFYFITLPVGKDYTFTVNRKGYLFYSDDFELSKNQPDSTYKKDIALQPAELNKAVKLKNIQFEFGAAKLEAISIAELDRLVDLLRENTNLSIQINGHSDNTGNAAVNLKLSTDRAKAVVDYLIGKGIAANRLKFKGFGSTKPIADNKTEEGRALNRRTEFEITGL